MLQNNHFDLEQHYLCDVCREAVTNPICPVCLTIEIDAWLTLYPNLRKELSSKLNKEINHIRDNATNTRCIKCKNKRASICPYCFTEHVLEELKTIKANKIIIKEFLEFFNFDLEHKGYFKEAERLGVV